MTYADFQPMLKLVMSIAIGIKCLFNMTSVSFGGFDSSFASDLQDSAVNQGLQVVEPGKANLHLHINPLINHLPSNPSSTIAVIAEPLIVRPDLYVSSTLKKYRECVTISRQRALGLGIERVFDLPITPPIRLPDNQIRDRRVCLVAGHKFSASKHSNYGFRRRILVSDTDKLIDLYGPDWLDPIWLELRRRIFAARLQLSHPKDFSLRELTGNFGKVFTSYKGLMDSRYSLMQRYQLSLVIENQSDYVSEKIWISIARGAVPIYVGPSLDSINSDLANAVFQVDPRQDSIFQVINDASDIEIESKRVHGYELLAGDWIATKGSRHVADTYINYLKEQCV